MTTLADFFTTYERRIFFGRRTDAEQIEIATVVAGMDESQRLAFKRQLWATHRQMQAARKAAQRGHSTLGTLLVAAAKDLRTK